MKPIRYALMAAVAAASLSTGAAQAAVLTGTFHFDVTTGNTSGNGFSTLPSATPFTGTTATADFFYTGALNFDNTAAQNGGSSGDLNSTFFATAGAAGPTFGITGYTGHNNFAAGNDNYGGGLADFLAGSGSASGFAYGSLYTIDLGVLTAGTILTITHDDGASVFQGSTQLGSTVAGPTTVTTDAVTITTTGDTTLYYSRQNGTPSILEVSSPSFTAGVPEPSTWAMMLIGFAGLGYMAFRRKSGSAFA